MGSNVRSEVELLLPYSNSIPDVSASQVYGITITLSHTANYASSSFPALRNVDESIHR